jgi:hypothetical protein
MAALQLAAMPLLMLLALLLPVELDPTRLATDGRWLPLSPVWP